VNSTGRVAVCQSKFRGDKVSPNNATQSQTDATPRELRSHGTIPPVLLPFDSAFSIGDSLPLVAG
jgi:hypothetical protein